MAGSANPQAGKKEVATKAAPGKTVIASPVAYPEPGTDGEIDFKKMTPASAEGYRLLAGTAFGLTVILQVGMADA